MRRSDLILGFALALMAHVGLFLAPGLSTEAKVAFQAGESALTLTLMPSVASMAMRATPQPEKVIDPADLIKESAPKPPPVKPKPEEPTPPKPKKVTSEFEIARIVNRIPPVKVHTVEFVNDFDRSISHVEDPTVTVEEIAADPKPQPSSEKKPEPKAETKPMPHDSTESRETVGDVRRKGVDVKATCSSLQKPEYPSCCRRRGHEGTVILEVTIPANGQCGDVTIIQSGGCPRMDEAAVEALRRASFTPARALGMPVTSTKRLKFVFRLTDE